MHPGITLEASHILRSDPPHRVWRTPNIYFAFLPPKHCFLGSGNLVRGPSCFPGHRSRGWPGIDLQIPEIGVLARFRLGALCTCTCSYIDCPLELRLRWERHRDNVLGLRLRSSPLFVVSQNRISKCSLVSMVGVWWFGENTVDLSR